MKVYINRKPVVGPWGGGNMWVQSMYSILPSLGISLVEISESPDVILIAGIGREGNCVSADEAIRYKEMSASHGRNVRLVMRVNENDARKSTTGVDDSIRRIARHCDHVVFVSRWLYDYFQAESLGEKASYIYNGVDSQIYRESPKLQNEKINIVTHHWSDNVMKGFDIYDLIDEWTLKNQDFTFTYIGRERGTFKNAKVVKPLFGKDLGEELGKYDVYVSASRFDPGPNHIIESISCGLPTYVHKDGGGCVEFAGQDHVYQDVNQLLNILSSKSYSKNTCWLPKNWEACVKSFYEVLKKVN